MLPPCWRVLVADEMSDAIEVPVPLAEHSYRVVVGSGLLTCAGARIRAVSKASRCALVTDSIVGQLNADTNTWVSLDSTMYYQQSVLLLLLNMF